MQASTLKDAADTLTGTVSDLARTVVDMTPDVTSKAGDVTNRLGDTALKLAALTPWVEQAANRVRAPVDVDNRRSCGDPRRRRLVAEDKPGRTSSLRPRRPPPATEIAA